MPFEIFIIILILVIVAIVLAVVYFRKYSNTTSTLSTRSLVSSVTIGMSEQEMLSIMGENYTKSLLKNSRTKYEYHFSNAHSVGSYCYGVSSRTYYGAKKTVIYCKNGYVEEVKSYNI